MNELHNHFSTLTNLAANCGIDWQKCYQLLNFDGRAVKRGIELDKSYRGKVWTVGSQWTAPDGKIYHTITFKTFKDSEHSETFNEWQETHQDRSIPRAYLPKKPTPAYKNHAERDRAVKIKRFTDFQKCFEQFPKVRETSDIGSYLTDKGFKPSDIPENFDLRRGEDKRGQFVVYPLVNQQYQTVGYQLLYDQAFTDYNGTVRNKQFVFYPNSKNGSRAWLGTHSPECEFIGECEGLATGLSAWLATGNPIAVCLDAGNLGNVHAELSKVYSNLLILADNDIKADGGNVGLFSAIKATGRGGKIAYPVLDNQKVDFDDLRQAKGLAEVAKQIAENRLDIPSQALEYYQLLASYAPVAELPKILNVACFFATKRISTLKQLRYQAKVLSQLRHTSTKTILKQLKKYLKKQLALITKENAITDFTDITEHDVTGKANAELARLVLSLGNAIIFDTRIMGAGKTELMKLLADYWLKRSLKKASHQDIKNFHFANGGTEQQWCKINRDPKLFKALQDKVNQSRIVNLADETKKTVYVCHRISLTSSASERLQLAYYDELQPYQQTDSLAVCVNSAPKHEVSKTVKVLFIDEIRQTLEHLLNGTVTNRLEVTNELIAAIQSADLVVCADADCNDFTVNWLKSIANKPIHALTQQTQKTGKKILQLGNANATIIHAKEALKKGLNVWIATDSMQQARKANLFLNCPNVLDKENAEDIMTELLADGDITENQVLLVHSENKGDAKQAAFLANPNEESKKYRLVIHTPVISSGISVTNTHFDRVYALFCNVLAPNEMLQTIARVRTAKEIFVSFKANHAKDRPTNVQDLIEGHQIKLGRFNPEKFVTEYDDFDKLRLKHIATRNAALNDYQRYFILLAQLKGYDFEQHDLTRWKIDGLGTAAREQKINQIYTASDIDAKEAAAIDLKSSPTQQETDSLHRYKVTQITGKAHADIDESDINFYLNNGLAKISNFELIHADINELKESDHANHKTRDRLSSKTSKHYLFKTVVDGLKDKRLNARGVSGVCQFLKDHHKELASNNMGNYAKVHKYPIKQLNQFLNKIGYELINDSKSHNGEQWYRMIVDPLVQQYADNRAIAKQQKANNDAVLNWEEATFCLNKTVSSSQTVSIEYDSEN